MTFKTLALAALATVALSVQAQAREHVFVVGSSTVFPFSTKVAQEFQAKTGKRVVVEATGSGGGHKLFCDGVGVETPDIANSSRRQKETEFQACQDNNVTDIVEVQVGFDGIVIANARGAAKLDLTLEQVYLALAKEIPDNGGEGDTCSFIPNPYTNWSQIDPALPDTTIEVYGPPPTSGTRDAFVEIAMEKGARKLECMRKLRRADEDTFQQRAHLLREDGKWIDGSETDNATVQTLVRTPTAIGVFGFSFLDQNRDKIQGANVNGTGPTFENIADGRYPISRSLYFYLKKQHVAVIDGLHDYALEFTSEEAWGPGGYLEQIGLIPLTDERRAEVREAVESLTPYTP